MTPKAYSIKAFCDAHSISKNLFYKLKKSGYAPKMIAVGARRLVTEEAAAAWRRTMGDSSETLQQSKGAPHAK